MQLEIVSPESTLLTADVDSVVVPGTDGSFQMLDNHAPIVSTLISGFEMILGVILEIFSPEFLSALLAIIVIDLVLAGDNAIVIAMAARNLPDDLHKS